MRIKLKHLANKFPTRDCIWKIIIKTSARVRPHPLTGRELDTEPHGHGHASVVDHVQRRYLAGFLAHHEEDLYVT